MRWSQPLFVVAVVCSSLGVGCIERNTRNRNPRDPAYWTGLLERAKTADGRRYALNNLFRLYEINRALSGEGAKHAKTVARLRQVAPPVLLRVLRQGFDKKRDDSVDLAIFILDLLAHFEVPGGALDPALHRLFTDYIKDPRAFGDSGSALIAVAVTTLAKISRRRAAAPKAHAALRRLVGRVCKSGRDTVEYDASVRIRRTLVRHAGDLAWPDPAATASLLSDVARAGHDLRGNHEPEVTAAALHALGELGAATPPVADALVSSLYASHGKRSFFGPARLALVKLNARVAGFALSTLGALLRGDPWRKGSGKLPRANGPMPTCPLARRDQVACRIFWRARQRGFHDRHPGLIPLRAAAVLAAIASEPAVTLLRERFGATSLRKRWLAEAMRYAKEQRRGDYRGPALVRLPGVYRQRVVIAGYDQDALGHRLLLRAAARLGDEAARRDIAASLDFAGDPTLMTVAAEAAGDAPTDPMLFERLVARVTTGASIWGTSDLVRRIRQRGWRRVVRGPAASCGNKRTVDRLWRECRRRVRGGANVESTCLHQLSALWLAELRYEVGAHLPGDWAKLVHPHCRPTDSWWTGARAELLARYRRGDRAVRTKLYACDPEGKGAPRCGTWVRCGGPEHDLCLSGVTRTRLAMHEQATLSAVTEAQAARVAAIEASDLIPSSPPAIAPLPPPGSPFHDADVARLIGPAPWGPLLEAGRRAKAAEVVRRRLCLHRRYRVSIKPCAEPSACADIAVGKRNPPVPSCERSGGGSLAPDPKAWRPRVMALRILTAKASRAAPAAKIRRLALATALRTYAASRSLPAKARRRLRRHVRRLLRWGARREADGPHACPHPLAAKAARLPCWRAFALLVEVERPQPDRRRENALLEAELARLRPFGRQGN